MYLSPYLAFVFLRFLPLVLLSEGDGVKKYMVDQRVRETEAKA
ncbi:unnamed protein product [Linum tenue]|uniref:Uncharacterized protein n=1 Tax=Linum tenue TaxID=586396 RepID=A0AAV0LKG2_9ROSI|nr:unnamed protein product [Linum tenue]